MPNDAEVVALFAVVPERYRAALWLGAGQGLRLSEVLGLEQGSRCLDFHRSEIHVVQQLRHSSKHHGGFYLATPKSGSIGSNDLDPEVADQLTSHILRYPPKEIELVDSTGADPISRRIALLFTTEEGKPINDRRWSERWARWRKAAGWPTSGTFHALRHYFATTLITNGVEPQAVQNALRHANLRVTLETYVHWWPKSAASLATP